MVSQQAMRVLVMVKPEICTIPSDGSSTCGLETLSKPGALIPSTLEPSGPTISPVKRSAKRTIITNANILVEQPHPMFIVLFQSPAFFLLLLFHVKTAKHTVKTIEGNYCAYAKSKKSI